MLIIENNSVYEIDEECLKKRNVPKECGTAQKAEEMKQKESRRQQPNRRGRM